MGQLRPTRFRGCHTCRNAGVLPAPSGERGCPDCPEGRRIEAVIARGYWAREAMA